MTGQPYIEALDTRRYDFGGSYQFLAGDRFVFTTRLAASSQQHDHRLGEARERDRHDMLFAEVTARGTFGERTLRFRTQAADIYEQFEKIGHIPLPPYIRRADAPADRERYQTVFARERGSVAAPTAGLHFTAEVLDEARARGAETARVTLHVGLGTFQPVRAERVEDHHMHAEAFHIAAPDAARMCAARRLVAVGTTSMRVLETAARRGGIAEMRGDTDIYIYPGFEFRAAGALLTNFHLPRTSLLLLVAAFAGAEFTLAAYRHAVEARYRFFSYGDCMLIV
jgi:S-adenosylmethionine:tRNA ribosyltransferase-isomerase